MSGLKVLSPEYTATMLLLPAASFLHVNTATPLTSFAVPASVGTTLNVTVPVGVPAPGTAAPTVALNVTAWPELEGLGVLSSAIIVAAWFSITVMELPSYVTPIRQNHIRRTIAARTKPACHQINRPVPSRPCLSRLEGRVGSWCVDEYGYGEEVRFATARSSSPFPLKSAATIFRESHKSNHGILCRLERAVAIA